MKHKLVLIFNEDSEVDGIDKCMVFNNERDAMHYLSTHQLSCIKIDPDSNWFSFKCTSWNGTGRAYWAQSI